MKRIPTAIATTLAFVVSSSALATMETYKEFKAKEPGATCQSCHTDKLPKKETHELNDFGKTVKAAKGKDGKIDWSKVKSKAPAPGVAR